MQARVVKATLLTWVTPQLVAEPETRSTSEHTSSGSVRLPKWLHGPLRQPHGSSSSTARFAHRLAPLFHDASIEEERLGP